MEEPLLETQSSSQPDLAPAAVSELPLPIPPRQSTRVSVPPRRFDDFPHYDYALFVKIVPSGVVVALVYIDDLLLTGDDLIVIEEVKTALHSAFTIKDIGLIRYFLGLEVSRTSAGIMLNYTRVIIDIDLGYLNFCIKFLI
ncbi:hypothetical protein V2J09_021840 [Rumex salicifolius]